MDSGAGDPVGGGPRGVLTLRGDPLAAPGRHELRTSCSYRRRDGFFRLGMIPDSVGGATTGPARFDIRARVDPSPFLPLVNGTHDADFELREVAAAGPATRYDGRVRLSLRIVDDTHPDFPIVHVEATGEGDGIRFDLSARCRAMIVAGGRTSTPRTDDHSHPSHT